MKWFFLLSVLRACTGNTLSSCPLEMNPRRIVVKFQDSFTVNCSSQADNIDSMGWEALYGKGTGKTDGVSSVLLEVESVKYWVFKPQCYINVVGGGQCVRHLSVTVYKTPDSVTIAQTSQMGPMEEGGKYRLQCDIANVAPAGNLSVHWRKGKEIMHTETFDESSVRPVNVSSVYTLHAARGDNGSQIWCEAELGFSPPVPNLPTVPSKAEEVIVLYPPTFTKPGNETVEFSTRSKVSLDCTATGNPMPVYSWHFPHAIQQTTKNKNENQSILTSSVELPGIYKCTASNTQGTKTKYFTVVEAPSGHPGTTAGILLAVFFVVISISGCVVYHKQRKSSVA